MSIKKDVTLETTGGTAGFHYLTHATIDRVMKNTMVQIQSYVSEDTYKAGKQPVSFAGSIAIAGLPEAGEDVFEFAEKALIEPMPEGTVEAQPAIAGLMLSRYALAGGEIV
jgi:hypothetical protein